MEHNTNKCFGLLLCFLLIRVTIVSQNIQFTPNEFSNNYFNPQNLGLSSPQVSSFMKPENAEIDPYTGKLNLKIELDHYKDPDFDITISLRYISEHFVPSRRSSYVGLNWNLEASGIICRTICGSPDDVRGNYTNSGDGSYLKDGLFVVVKEGTFKHYLETDLLNFNIDKNEAGHGTPYHWGDFKYDMEPDIFSFKFGTYSGKFLINNQGVPVIIADKGYRIDLSQLAVQSYSTTDTPISSIIKITTPDGYIYEFGGSTDYLEYSIPNNPEKCLTKPRSIISWMLKSIVAPNGRSVNYLYESVMQTHKYNYYISSSYEDFVTRTYSDSSRPSQGLFGGANSTNEQIVVEDKTYTPILKKISIDAVNYSFNLSDNGVGFYNFTDYTVLLSSMDVDIYGVNMKKVSFQYDTVRGYSFMILLNNNGLKYSFDYRNKIYRLPPPLTTSTDHWGGWKGGYDTSVNVSEYCKSLFENREVNPTYCDIGLLTHVKYPSGGISRFEYEPNDYNHYYEKDMSENKLIRTDLVDKKICSGSRIHKIIQNKGAGAGDSNVRCFFYIDNNGKGSGSICVKPQYIINEVIVNSTYGSFLENGIYYFYSDLHRITYRSVSANSYFKDHLLSEQFVSYSDVVEKFEDNSYNCYHYSSYQNMPDVVDRGGWIVRRNVSCSNRNELQQFEKFGLYIENSMAMYRGKLLLKQSFSNSGKLVYSEKNIYNSSHFNAAYNISIKTCAVGVSTYKIYLTPCQLIQQQITNADGVVVTKDMVYNQQNLLSRESYIGSDGEQLAIKYKYPSDIPFAFANELCQRNILNLPIEIVYLCDDQIVAAYHNRYALFEGLMLKKYYYELETEEPIKESNFQSLVDMRYKIREKYLKYDSFGRPLHILKKGNINHSLIWGYKSNYIIASIENATYDEVKKGLGIAPETYSDVEIPYMNRIDNLRVMLPNSLVTTYVYAPLIGLTGETSPDGRTTRYEYDGYRQLVRIKDSKWQTVEEYKYRYNTMKALSLDFNYELTYGMNEQVYFAADASGGTHNYSFQWTIKNWQGKVTDISYKDSMSYRFPAIGRYTIECSVTDDITKQTEIVSHSVSIVENVLRFKNIKCVDVGAYFSQGELYCPKPVSVTFRLSKSGNCISQFNIGNRQFSYGGDIEQKVTVALPAGKTVVSVDMRSPAIGNMAFIEMLKVDVPNVQITNPRAIFIDKTF